MVVADLERGSQRSWIEQLPADLDVVIHCAALVHSFNRHHFYQVNRDGTALLLDLLAARYSHLKFILLSSQAAAGPADGRGESICEADDPMPIGHYGRSKLAAEKLVLKLAPEGWQTITLRPPMVLGPDDPAILDLFKMVQNRLVVVPGLIGGSNKRYSFISIFDLVEMIGSAVKYQPASQGELFFVAHPVSTTYGELIQTIKSELGIGWLIKLPLPLPLLYLAAWLLNIGHHLLGIDFRLTPDKVPELHPSFWLCSSQLSITSLGGTYQWDLKRSISSIAAKLKKN
jgi:nucleoside-diphosphate-sugar epimerase